MSSNEEEEQGYVPVNGYTDGQGLTSEGSMSSDDLSSDESSDFSVLSENEGWASEESTSSDDLSSDESSVATYWLPSNEQQLLVLCNRFAAEEYEESITDLRRWIDENRSDDMFFRKAAGYSRGGITPLHSLSLSSNPPLDVVQALIAHAPETLKIQGNRYKNLPLHCLCQYCDCDDFLEIVKAMVAAYPDCVTIKNRRGRLPIHEVCNCSDNISNLDRKLQILDFLIEVFPESILVKDEDNITPSQVLQFSIEYYLEENGNDIQNKNEHMFLLHQVTAGEFSFDLFKFFLEAFPESCKLQDGNGMTPLHHACINCEHERHISIVFILVSQSPMSCNVKDNYGRTPAQLFRKEASLEYENGKLAMHNLAKETDKDGRLCSLLLFLFQSFPEGVSMPDNSGMLPFHYAALNEASSVEFVMHLIRWYPECVTFNN